MKRPILVVTIGYILGVIWGLYFKISIVFLYILIISLLIILKKSRRVYRYVKLFLSINVILCLIIMSFLSNSYIKLLNKRYDTLYKNVKEGYFTGTIVDIGKEKEYKTIYKIKIENINSNFKFKDTLIYLNIKNTFNISLKYGDKICFWGEFEYPKAASNYKGFDYKEYLKNLKIYGNVDYIRDVKIIKKDDINLINKAALDLKYNIIKKADNLFSENEKSIFFAISIGYMDYLSGDIKESFRNSSLSHILAISGSHISYIILGLTVIFKTVNINTRISKIITSIVLIFYMFLIDFTPSVTRACIMGIILLLSSIIYRKKDLITTTCISLLFILVPNPYNIRNIGFLLSYGGACGIILFKNNIMRVSSSFKTTRKSGLTRYTQIEKAKNNLIKYVKDGFYTTISAQIIIFPIIIYNFNLISLNFLLSNLLANFIVGIITIGGFIICIIALISTNISKIISIPYSIFLNLLVQIAKICSELPLSQVYILAPSVWTIIFYYIIIFLMNYIYSLSLKKEKRITEVKIMQHIKKILNSVKTDSFNIIVIILLFILILNCVNLVPKNLKVYFIDVGQGDSTLIISPTNKKILIDGGGSENLGDFDIGENVLLPYLLDRKITKLDYVIVSHFDADHCNGLIAVLENIKVNNLIISKQVYICEEYTNLISIAQKRNIKIKEVKKGDKINIDKYVYLDILYPEEKLEFDDLNNNSIVCKLVYKSFSMLFTGDIEQIAEDKILRNKSISSKLESTILKVAHHGSKTSSTEQFIDAVNPKIALIGVGSNNNFGHPNTAVIERLKKREIKIYRTDENGEINIYVNSNRRSQN